MVLATCLLTSAIFLRIPSTHLVTLSLAILHFVGYESAMPSPAEVGHWEIAYHWHPDLRWQLAMLPTVLDVRELLLPANERTPAVLWQLRIVQLCQRHSLHRPCDHDCQLLPICHDAAACAHDAQRRTWLELQ
jgi:hypothetical protein